ncbi:MAG TPA: nucleotidyltransferase family protein [Actinomycetota bacterium]|nr:nucleotidyltransferase family protein [Actinomycetota bacterium]
MLAAVVLAAGTSSRLGQPKQLLPLDGRPVLQHVLDIAAAAGAGEIVVVLGHAARDVRRALTLPDGARVVVNPDYELGQSTSLRAGLAALGPHVDAAAILLGDQPRLPPDVMRAVVDAHARGDAAVVRPSYRGVPGHPVIATRAAWPALTAVAGDAGARTAMDAARVDVRVLDVDMDAPADVDTWDSYVRLRDG